MKTQFYVNDEKKIVVCKLVDCAGSLICDMCHKNWPASPELEIDDVFVGKAKLHPDDAFDLEKGEQIAFRRAVAKLAKAKARALRAFMKKQERVVNDLKRDTDKLLRKYEYNIDKRDADIQYIIDTPVTAEETK